MFGSCALNKKIVIAGALLFLPWIVVAQTQSQDGTVLENAALVYSEADFDAPVIDTLTKGEVYKISAKKKGPFYKIKVQSGKMGWIAESDISPGRIRLAPQTIQDIAKDKNKKEKNNFPYFATRYRALAFDYINYTEDTVGGEQSAFLPFVGMKFYGFNTFFSGEIYTESNLLVAFQGPSYYKDLTGVDAKGYVVMGNFLFQTPTPRGKNAMSYYGLGPMFKYSHFDIEVPQGGSRSHYSANDLTLGVLMNIGFGYRYQRISFRLDGKYYWEQKQYYGFGSSIGLDF